MGRPPGGIAQDEACTQHRGSGLLSVRSARHELPPAAPRPAPGGPATRRLPALGGLTAASTAVSRRRRGRRSRWGRQGGRCSSGSVHGAGWVCACGVDGKAGASLAQGGDLLLGRQVGNGLRWFGQSQRMRYRVVRQKRQGDRVT